MFKYSERPGTYAAKHLPDNVSEETKIARLNELIKLQTEVSAEQNSHTRPAPAQREYACRRPAGCSVLRGRRQIPQEDSAKFDC